MTYRSLSLEQILPSRRHTLFTVAILAVAAGAGLAAANEPMAALAVVAAAVTAAALLHRPDIATLLVIFLLYANLAVVAVRFHHVPYLLGAAFPLLLAWPLANYLIVKRQRLVVSPVMVLILLFLVIQLLGVLFSDDSGTAFANLIVFISEGALLYFLIINVVRTPEVLRGAIWALLIAGILLGTVPIYQQITGTFDNDYGGLAQVTSEGFRTGEVALQGEVRQPRLSGAIGEKNRYAQIMLMLVPLGFYQAWNERSKTLRALAFVATAICALGAALAFSRGAAVGFVLLILIMLAMRAIRPRQLLVMVLGVGLLIAAMPQYTTRIVSIQSVRSMLGDTASRVEKVDGAIQGRTTAMIAAMQVYLDYPVVGVGPGMVQYYTREYGNKLDMRYFDENREAHSLYLAVAADTGTLGIVVFLAILFLTLKELNNVRLRRTRDRPDLAHMATGFMLSVIAYMTTGLFLHLSYQRYFWLMMALAGAAYLVAAPSADGTGIRGESQ